jgi:hypothetical protein
MVRRKTDQALLRASVNPSLDDAPGPTDDRRYQAMA